MNARPSSASGPRPSIVFSRRALLALAWWTAQSTSLAAAVPPIAENGHSYQVPAGTGREVYRFGDGGPAPVQAFFARNGRGWRVYWDDDLGTARYLHPVGLHQVVPVEAAGPEGDAALIARAVETFIGGNADFFGVDASCLGEPSVRRLSAGWLIVFAETTRSGIAVRGGNLRAIVLDDGSLGWIKAFILRDCPEPAEPVIDESLAWESLASDVSAIHAAELQIGFPGTDPAASIPIWSLKATDVDGAFAESIVDARTGEVLARRRVVKHFTAEGVVLGWRPSPHDRYASPQSGARVPGPVGGITIRDAAGRPLGRTAGDGSYRLEVGQNPATLTFSLERGELGGGPGKDYVRRLEIAPLGPSFGDILRPEEDIDGDGVLDLTITQIAEERGLAIFNGGTAVDDQVLRAWALQCHDHAASVLDFAGRAIQDFGLTAVIPPLRIIPKPGSPIQEFVSPSPQANGFAEIITTLTFDGTDEVGNPFTESVVPTILMHEVGHHVFFALTNVEDAGPLSIEEAAADLVAAFAQGGPELGFKAPGQPTPLGFRLGETGDFRRPLRAKFGNAFWKLFELLADPFRERGPEPLAAAGLLFHWLEAHRSERGDHLIFDETRSLRDELLRLDATVMARSEADRPCAPCHQREIIQAFGRDFFAGPFLRGDPNLDQKVDLSDAVSILNFLFAGLDTFHDCRDSLDANDTGSIDITDAIRVLLFLFQGGGSLPEPFPACGLDVKDFAGERDLGCFEYTCPR